MQLFFLITFNYLLKSLLPTVFIRLTYNYFYSLLWTQLKLNRTREAEEGHQKPTKNQKPPSQ